MPSGTRRCSSSWTCARYSFRAHVQAGDVAYLARLVALDRRQALDPVVYDVMEIDPAPGEWPFCGGRE